MSTEVREQTGPSGYVYVTLDEPCEDGDYCYDVSGVATGTRRICSTLDPSVCNQDGTQGMISWYEEPSLTEAQRVVKVVCDYNILPENEFAPKNLREPCIDNSECAAGLTCSGGLCLSNLNNFCQTDNDCLDGRCLVTSAGGGVCIPFPLDTESDENKLLTNILLYVLLIILFFAIFYEIIKYINKKNKNG